MPVCTPQILVADVEPSVSSFLVDALLSEGYRAIESQQRPRDTAEMRGYDALMVELLPTNAAALHELQVYLGQLASVVPCVICSTSPGLLNQFAFLPFTRCATLQLPCSLEQLYDTVERLLTDEDPAP